MILWYLRKTLNLVRPPPPFLRRRWPLLTLNSKVKGQTVLMKETIACSIFWNPLARQTSSSVHIYMYPWRSRWSLLKFKPWGQRSKAKLLKTLKSILYSASLEPFAFLLSTLQISFSCSILPHESEACLHISDTFIVPLKMPL